SAVLSAAARAARAGVLVKGGIHLENLGRVSAIAFDKTGTITLGKPRVVEVIPFEGTEAELLRLAAAVESRSGHPLARAVVEAARSRGLTWPEAVSVQSVTGKGLRAEVAGQPVLVGNLRLFEPAEVPDAVWQAVTRMETAGQTTVLVRANGAFRGVLGLADVPRSGARDVLDRLRRLGIRKTIMLTGDNDRVARAIGQAVGIDEVRASLLPEDKVRAVEGLVRQLGAVAMVGDGVNDAPALARATVGIAMGGASTDVALETADIALMADDLGQLPFAVELSRASRRVIRQNLWVSLGAVAVLIPAAVLGWAGLGTAVSVHEGSTVLVVANALRLLRFRAGTEP
ncbi:MAG: heavy metal translocating P-type ATPase, partial [Candidatus Rokuibacteriota bacterium]